MTDSDVVRAFYDALNANGVDAAVALLDPAIVRVEWEGLPNEGRFRGHDELRDHIVEGRSTWAEGACDPERCEVVGNWIVVTVHVHVRRHGKSEWIDGRVTDVFAVRDGRITEFRSFMVAGSASRFVERASA